MDYGDAQFSLLRFSNDAGGPDLTITKSRGAFATIGTIVADDDTIGRILFLADDGGDLATPTAMISSAVDGGPSANDVPGRLVFSTNAGGTSATERLRIDSAGGVFIGDTANDNMTVGLTINQGAADDQAFALKSSDVGHAMTAIIEADTYGSIQKSSATTGGLLIEGFTEAAQQAVYFRATTGTATQTADTSTSDGAFQFTGFQTDGSTGRTSIAATGNIMTIDNNAATRWLIKGNGDVHQTTDAHTALDSWDDGALVRAYETLTADPASIIRDEWDHIVEYNEADLIAAGILGVEGRNGLTNTSQLQRLHSGAIWQSRAREADLESRIIELETTIAGLLPAGE